VLRVRIKMRSGRYAPPRQDADTGEGYQELRPPVHDERYGLPDMDVHMGRFEGRNMGLGPRVLGSPRVG
jgi:hypothetical protein